jgi:hypothetical protein
MENYIFVKVFIESEFSLGICKFGCSSESENRGKHAAAHSHLIGGRGDVL